MRGRAVSSDAPNRPRKWVLYRENNNTHREMFVVGFFVIGTGARGPIRQLKNTTDVEQARPFESASDAYEYGAIHALDHWRAGLR